MDTKQVYNKILNKYPIEIVQIDIG